MPDTKLPDAISTIATLIENLDLKVRYLPTASLVAFGRKTRTHTKDHIALMAKVMGEFGCIVPIIVDEADKILAGNGRVEAARLLGLEAVPTVRVAHLTKEQKRAFVIADNRLAELAGWDRDTLKIEFEELSDVSLDFDVELTGFTSAEIEGFLVRGLNDDDEDEQKKRPPRTRPASLAGDIWILGEHRLICADSTDPATLERLLQGDKVRTVFTDPPYNVPVAGHVTGSNRHGEFVMASGEMSDEDFTRFLGKVWSQINAALAPGGLAYLCMDWRHMRHTLEALDGANLELLNLIVWDKRVGGMGSFYRSQHELVFLAKKGGEAHLNRVELGKNGRNRTNVWAYDGMSGVGDGKAKARDLHPTVKPMAMVRDALLDCSAPGELVLDLFCGSGTILVAAEAVRRRARAVELDPDYVDTGVIRWQDYTGLEARLEETGETFVQVSARRAVTGEGA
jgi:DNA modification methylase